MKNKRNQVHYISTEIAQNGLNGPQKLSDLPCFFFKAHTVDFRVEVKPFTEERGEQIIIFSKHVQY